MTSVIKGEDGRSTGTEIRHGPPERVVAFLEGRSLRRAAAGVTMAALVSAFITIGFREGGEFGLNVIGLFSLAVTALGLYLAIAIFRRQAAESDAESAHHRSLMSEIKQITMQTAESAGRARVNTDRLLILWDHVSVKRTGKSLTGDRRERALAVASSSDLISKAHQILWVDDHRDWVQYERQVLAEMGILSVWVQNTTAAMGVLQGNDFAAVITDMGRAEGDREGFALLGAMRDAGMTNPVFVYSSSDRPEDIQAVLDSGGQGATNDPSRLFQLVVQELADLS